MSKGYVVALLKLTNKEHFVNDYATKVPAIIEEFGGRIVARTPNAHFREGKEFSLHVVVEFDDFEKYCDDHPNGCYIVKPNDEQRGEGIFVT